MIGLFNDCFPPIMDGVSLTTQNYAYWLHKKTGNVCVVTPKSPDARDAEEYPVYRYSSIPIPMRKPYRLGFPRIDWPFHERISRLSFERPPQPAAGAPQHFPREVTGGEGCLRAGTGRMQG